MQTNPQKLVRLANTLSMREMDKYAIDELKINGLVLMENAARSVADWIEEKKLKYEHEARVVVCCGKGNNGGDGFAIARLLKNRGYDVSVVDSGEAKKKDARENQLLWEKFGESTSFPGANAARLIEEANVLIDAIFGIGINQVIEGSYREWIEIFNQNTEALRIAVDIPSGVSTDESKIFGIAVKCNHTITFQKGKTGCYQYPGASYCGKVHIVDISIPDHWPEIKTFEQEENNFKNKQQHTYLLTNEFVKGIIPKRLPDAHKGSCGHLLSICGSKGMGGAASLSSMGALKIGAGLVTACVPNKLRDNLPGQTPEIMTISPSNVSEYFTEDNAEFVEQIASVSDAIVLGCGLGVHSQTTNFVKHLVKHLPGPLLIDADGLNNLEKENLKERLDISIITPHPLELSRLCGQSVTEIQESRISTVRRLSQEWNVIILLKGAYTVIGNPNEEIFINPTGNCSLATAGSGDILAGLIVGLLAQGIKPYIAACCGVWVHSASSSLFDVGMIADDLLLGIPKVLSKLRK